MGRYMMASSAAEAQISFFIPEIQAVPETVVADCLKNPEYKNYAVWLQKILRLKKYILSEKEERLFALQSESMQTPSAAFSMREVSNDHHPYYEMVFEKDSHIG